MRILRWVFGILGVLLLAAGAVAAVGVVWLRGEAGQRWILEELLAVAQPHAGSLSVATLHTDLWSELQLEGVVLRDASGTELAGLDRLEVEFTLRGLLTRTLRIHRVTGTGLRASVEVTDSGVDIAEIWIDPSQPPAPSGPWEGLPITLVIEGIDVAATRAALTLRTGEEDQLWALTGATLRGGLRFEGDQIVATGVTLDTRTEPDLGPVTLSATVAYDPRRLTVETLALGVGVHRLEAAGSLSDLDTPAILTDIELRSIHLEPEALPWELPLVGVFEAEGALGGQLDAPELSLRILTPGGPIGVGATLDLRPDRPVWTARVEALEVALDTFVDGLDPTTLTLDVEAEGEGLTWPDGLDARAHLVASAPVLAPVGWASAEVEASLGGGVLIVDRLTAATPSGTVAATAWVDLVHERGTAQVHDLDLLLADLARFGARGLHGTVRYRGELEGDWSGAEPSGRVDGWLTGRRLGYQDADRIARIDGPVRATWADGVGSLAARIDVFHPTPTRFVVEGAAAIADDGFEDLGLVVTSGETSLAVDGDLHTRGSVALGVAVEAFPVSALALVSPALVGSSGLLALDARADGRWSDLELAATLTADTVAIPGVVRGVSAVARVDGRDEVVHVDVSATSGAEPLATLRGSLPFSLDLRRPGLLAERPVDALLVVPAISVEVWNAVLDGAEIPTLRGQGELHLSGTLLAPEVRLVAGVELPTPDADAPWIGIDVVAAVVGERLDVDGALREGEAPLATLDGTARMSLPAVMGSLLGRGPRVDLVDPALWADDLALVLTPDVPLQSLAAFVDVPAGVGGRIEGVVRVEGSLAVPVLTAELAVVEASLDALSVSPATLSVKPAPGGHDVAIELGFGADGGVRVVGRVPIEFRFDAPLATQLERPGLALEVTGEGVPVAAIAALWPEMREATGRIRIGGSVRGTLAAPSGDLRATADGIAFHLLSTGVAYDQVRFTLGLTPTAVELRDLHVRTTAVGENPDRGIQGTIDGEVVARLDGTTLGEWSGHLDLNRPLLASGDRLLRLASGRVAFSGTPPAVEVKGALAIEEARVHLDERFFATRAATEPPTWLRVHRSGDEAALEAVDEGDVGIPDWLRVHLGLDLGGHAFVRAQLPLSASLSGLLGPFGSMTVDTQADGRLAVDVKDGALSIVGQVVPIRGTAVLFGKPFELRDDSTISFTGRDYQSPVLALHATYDTRSYGLVEANIQGVPEALKVTLSSAEYPSQDDVISLLLVGKPASELASGEGASDGATALAMSMLLTTAGQTVGRVGERAAAMLISPDLLVVGNGTARVGKRIGRRMFLVVDFDNTADDQTESMLILTLEVALGGPWQAELHHGTAGEDSVEVNWTRRY